MLVLLLVTTMTFVQALLELSKGASREAGAKNRPRPSERTRLKSKNAVLPGKSNDKRKWIAHQAVIGKSL